jgi:diaminopimelate decarboxylase
LIGHNAGLMSEQGQAVAGGDPIAGSAVLPRGSRVNEEGHLEVAGCDVVALAEEHGTPAYVYAEDDIRSRAREYREAFESRGADYEVLFASKSFPCTAAYRLLAEEGLSADVASGGELHMALKAGFDPDRIHMHGNNKSDEEILFAARAGIRHLILDSFDEIERCERLLDEPQRVLIRVTPGIKPSTHDYITTGQLDSKFGFGLEDGLAAQAVERVLASDKLKLVGLHAHIGSQIFELEPYTLAIRALGELAGDWCRVVNVGGGLGVAYTAEDEPPSIDAYVDVKVRGVAEVFGEGVRVLVEPGRSLVANAGITAYRVGTVKEIPGVRTYVAVDGGMSDNLRPMLYGAQYEALIADRAAAPADTLVTVAGMHCESSDMIVRDAMLAEPAVGDVLVTPATGAYGYAMASNYNGVPRPPVVFCRDGEARAVVRRETYEDLTARDL